MQNPVPRKHFARDYSIIIPSYNEEKLLPGTLESVRESMQAVPGRSGEVIVTDNNSTDRTAEVAKSFGARVLFEKEQQIARARNAGGKASQGKYLIFLDADTRISPRLLALTLDTLDRGKYCGGGTLPQFDVPLDWGSRLLLRAWHALSKTFKWAAGSYVFCLREAFEDIGGFDERFYASEEIHFSQALKRWGRSRHLRMIILNEPVITSARKMDWYGTAGIFKSVLAIGLRPWDLKNRDRCAIWYERPEEKERPDPQP